MNTIHVGWMVGPVVLAQTESPSPPAAPSGPALSSETPGATGIGPGPTGGATDPGTLAPAGKSPQGARPPGGLFGGGSEFIYIILAMFVVMILVSSMGGRKEKRRRAEMLASLARNDKVHTVGGLIGTIADVHDQEVVLRTDETSNTRVRVARSAITQVIKPGGVKPAGPELEAKPAAPVRT